MTTAEETEAPSVKRYRKKPIEVETLQWTGGNLAALEEFTGGRRNISMSGITAGELNIWNEEEQAWIPCLPGHSVVKGALGEFYPISPAALAATYEPVAATTGETK